MSDTTTRAGLEVDQRLADLLEREVFPALGRDPSAFWEGFAQLLATFAPRNKALLEKREDLQAKIDAWHTERAGKPHEAGEYRAFLEEIGYLVPEPGDFTIGTQNVDAEIATMAGPQLVVPILNARFLLNAANARWGSLYDAFYGTDALNAPPARPGGYDEERGAAVIARGREFLDQALPLVDQSWADLADEHDGKLQDESQWVGHTDKGLLFKNNGIHIEVVFDRDHPVGKTDKAGIADINVEAALTTIADCEDSVAAVDGEDKLTAYTNWLGIIRGDLEESFEKGGRTLTRKLARDKTYKDNTGTEHSLSGRSLMFVRNVGHLMTNPAIRLPDGSEIPEGIMDAVFTSAISALDVEGHAKYGNSRHGSIYIVKPKMHGPEECAFTNDLFDAVEDLLGLPRHTIKVGVMDEERRTSANLGACIHAVRDRIVFINTGFLDRTGDEIHTSMRAGPMMRKGAMKGSDWLAAYEARNVAIGLKHGLSGKAQIGKGMWAAPDMMADMMEQKIGHLRAGANTAWVPSPTAATLHALHYHQENVFVIQKGLGEIPSLDTLLTIPLAEGANWSQDELRDELDNNCQGLLGYVVRWVDAGVGCSKVPDINDVGLMEDRATLRISSQHIANWLLHGVVTEDQVMDSLTRMAAKVDEQNAGDPFYEPLIGNEDKPAFSAAKDLIFKGVEQPSGYTEPLLHQWRQVKKAS
ncbi:malate synthase G [Erythrobacter sp. NAP1]|uniref:malate synthase G n=1 Tax=Erythrobacter sp. NAP1 TaxID=237727 RepID=UPI0000685143|nr:malate synthase G [Erythrobacter sp. NAP1]EAQ27585.1 malate synthase G [Erythrobacter sp. NAP1]